MASELGAGSAGCGNWRIVCMTALLMLTVGVAVVQPRSSHGQGREPQGKGPPIFGSAAISRDGHLVAIPVTSTASEPAQLLIYDRRTDTIVRVPPPEGWDIDQPVFSPDGRSIAAFAACATACQSPPDVTRLVELRIAESKWRTISSGTGIRRSPSYFPDGQNLVVVEADVTVHRDGQVRSGDQGLAIVNVKTGRSTERVSATERFQYIFSPSVTQSGTVVFSGYTPRRPDLLAKVLQLKAPQGRYIQVGWQAKLERRSDGHLGEPMHVEMLPFTPEILPYGVSYLQAASSGTIAFVSATRTGAPVDGRGAIKYDVFSYSGGTLRQVTNAGLFLSGLAISGDGDFAVVRQGMPRDVPAFALIHLPTGRMDRLPLLEKLPSSF
jgi:hypothetical protein